MLTQKYILSDRCTPDPFHEWTKLPPLWRQVLELEPKRSAMMAEVLGKDLYYHTEGADQRRYDVRIRALAVGKVLLKYESISRAQLIAKIGQNFGDKGVRFLKRNKFIGVRMKGTMGRKGYSAVYLLTDAGKRWVERNKVTLKARPRSH